MSLIRVLQHASSQRLCFRSSYTGISRLTQTRHRGNTLNYVVRSPNNAVRSFASSESGAPEPPPAPEQSTPEPPTPEPLTPEESLRKTLDEFKATIRHPSWKQYHDNWNDIKKGELGREITMFGYLSTRRDVKRTLSMTQLRHKDLTRCIQLICSSKDEGSEEAISHARMKTLREWTPVMVRGKLKSREPPKNDTHLGMKLIVNREIEVLQVEPLNEMPNDLIIKEETVFGPDQRHLQLRIDRRLRDNILFRADASQRARLSLSERNWKEIETPVLFKSTPEGAREFLVPTRNKGLAYALPQSPQQYKQLLMASGFTKYFQFAHCFRDEDLRADRQPEFTQLDMEMSFAGEEDIMSEIELTLRDLWYKTLKHTIIAPFPRLTYQEAMAAYGSDKPDLRFGAKIQPITKYLPADLISKITPIEAPVVEAFKLRLSDDPKTTRKFISSFLDSPAGKPFLSNPDGEPGVFVGDLSQPMQGLGPLGYGYVMEGPGALSTSHGDLLILQARANAPFSGGSRPIGNLRLALWKAAIAQGLIEAPRGDNFQFVWITDFPLFSPTTDADPGQGGTAGLSSTHHPFTAPKTPADVDLLLTAPHEAVAAHYDIVVNGVELGGGSRRIHHAIVQEFIFRDVLKMKPERIEDFRHLLDVLRSGCPPHVGIALGWDRLMAMMCGSESVRDVIAFPKSGRGEDLLVGSPNAMTPEQLDTYHLKVKE
ncbi:aspartyl-tRNA synthetase-like protein [Dothidotthia symphoricarpi CBS 119687]|uniref:Aspartyl-tRNA synthetase-like protein n=1 Tax=Dothidotthia symphoricarpi CBS 119687 TaxID=1392245 RepID=A0A6A6AM64_9PLEO|nr:aspartyl-tRNA synthetase-like protein [Dothidotthia symphoricarpi CBS 119687]KAF2132024.1 aspartyl-tRNA synthetase-like protein [Dothidotthia symphoricarpi CBS 119687]